MASCSRRPQQLHNSSLLRSWRAACLQQPTRLLKNHHRVFHSSNRFFASNGSSNPQSRVDRIINRLPRFLQRYVLPLRTAPLTHISSFLILHEITAVVPLLALTGIFHYTQWLPPYISEGKWVSIGMDKFGRYFRKKGWLKEDGRMTRWWGRGETGFKLVAEVATAWAITKALLPLRLILSVWATPWFARAAVMPSMARFKQLWVMITRRGGPPKSGAAGTGATGGRVVAKTPSGQIKKGE